MIGFLLGFLPDFTSWLMLGIGVGIIVASYAAPYVTPAAGFLAPLCSVARVLGLVLAVVAGARLYASHEVDLAAAKIQAEATAAVSAAKDREREASIAALSKLHTEEIERLQRSATVKRVIANVQPNPACAVLPASGAALDELRARHPGAGSPGVAGGNVRPVSSP